MDRYHLQTSFSFHSIPPRLAGAASVCFLSKCGKRVTRGLVESCISKPLKNVKSNESIHTKCHKKYWYYSPKNHFNVIFRMYVSLHMIEKLILPIHHRLSASTHTGDVLQIQHHHCRCSSNTEKFVLAFAPQWYNYYYYQTCAANYNKNAELLFAISPL